MCSLIIALVVTAGLCAACFAGDVSLQLIQKEASWTPVSGRAGGELTYKAEGEHRVVFFGAGLASGIYLVQLTTGVSSQTYKLILLK